MQIIAMGWHMFEEGTVELCDDLASLAESVREVALGQEPLTSDAEPVHAD